MVLAAGPTKKLQNDVQICDRANDAVTVGVGDGVFRGKTAGNYLGVFASM